MFANMTPELQDRYFREFMYEMDQKSRMRTAREDGIAEGKAEGLPIEVIARCTGLTQDQIAEL